MFVSISLFMMLNSMIDKDAVLSKAAENGFFYRQVDISKVEKCDPGQTCVKHGNHFYKIERKDSFKVELNVSEKTIKLNIKPEKIYISYFLYIWHKAGVHKIQLKKRELVIDKGVANILKLQLTGTSPGGPAVIWEKKLKESPSFKFEKDFQTSINKIRKIFFQRPLDLSTELKPAAEEALKKVQNAGLKHYSSKTGGVRHSGVHKKILGENLFIAENPERAWEMLTRSPSHLYNIINPQFKHQYTAFVENEEGVFGATVFSD